MTFRSTLCRLVLSLVLVVPLAGHAQLFRAYLSSTGSDANGCTLQLPCRLLPRAMAVVAAEGEVWMLDSANYNTGTVAINKSVSILAVPGAVGSLVANGADALAIDATGAKVSLKNLVFAPVAGAPPVGSGVVVQGPITVSVEDCTFTRLPSIGINVTGSTNLRVRNSTFRDNGGNGIVVQNGSTASIDRSIIDGNNIGILAQATSATPPTRVSVTGSNLAGNTNGIVGLASDAGASVTIWAQGNAISGSTNHGISPQVIGAGSVVVKAVQNTLVGNGGTAILVVGAGAKALSSGNTITDNNKAYDNGGGLLENVPNNVIRDNATVNSGAITGITLQ